jgi:hypothetical protein
MERTVNEALDGFESMWAPRMRAASLAAELQFEVQDVRWAAKCLGALYNAQLHHARARRERISIYPASVVIALSGIGALEYEAGTYWSAVWDITGVQGDANTAQEWGAVFLTALGRFDCPRFEDLPLKYVGPILLHAGVPRHCLPDLVDMIMRRSSVDGQLDGSHFVQWATAPGRDSRIAVLAKPAQAFLRDAGEFAVDWVDRLIDLVDRLRDPSADLEGVRLPEWVVEEVRKHLAARGPRARAPRIGRGLANRGEEARLGLDPFGAGVHLVLPPVGEQPDGLATWHVTLDGELHSIRSQASWPGSSETAPGTTLTLARPVRSASVSLGTSNLSTEVEVVDAQDPLLVFSMDGRRMPAGLPLVPEPAWVLYPTSAVLQVDGDAASSQSAQVPYGWDGWTLKRIELSGVRRLRVEPGSWRFVRGSSRARLELCPPLVGVSTVYGNPVYATPPAVLLPSTEGAAASWSLVVRRPGGDPVANIGISTSTSLRVDLFAGVPRPLLGAYQVRVRGPLGRGLSREIEIVDDLDVEASPPWREFGPQGLVPCDVTVRTNPQARAIPREAKLAPAQSGFQVEVSDGERTEAILVSPPHMSVQVLGPGSGSEWSDGPVTLDSETLSTIEALAIKLPDQIGQGMVVLLQGQLEVQSTPVSSGSGGAARLDVRRFTDTIGEAGTGHLELDLVGRRIPLALVRPRRLTSGRLTSGVELHPSGFLSLRDGSDVEGLTVAVYRLFKPWLDPIVAPAEALSARPLTGVVGEGPLLVHVRVVDPWMPAAWPAWPPSENTYRCEAPLNSEIATWEDQVAAWLSGTGAPPSSDESPAALMTIYGLNDELARNGIGVPIRDGVGQALSQMTVRQLAGAVTTTRASSRTITAALVHSGTVWASSRTQEETLPDASLWGRSATATILTASWALEEGSTVAREDLIHAAGSVSAIILNGQDDPHASIGRFGPEAPRLASMSKQELERLWSAANIVPAHLLDADSRAIAARQLFDARSRPGCQRIAPMAHEVAERLLRGVLDHGAPRLARAIEARTSSAGWQSLPAMSIALALTSRLAARGDVRFQSELESLRHVWAALARCAPDLVEVDIVLAECLVLGNRK